MRGQNFNLLSYFSAADTEKFSETLWIWKLTWMVHHDGGILECWSQLILVCKTSNHFAMIYHLVVLFGNYHHDWRIGLVETEYCLQSYSKYKVETRKMAVKTQQYGIHSKEGLENKDDA